ncbi:Kelch repeat-containing protein [Pseudarthrobacter sp. NPDC092424]|uniref:Kelch repeat-containing protein n=3 Tax=Micrococcaceae TaxID=1268 RepID=UPI003412F061
MAWLDGAVNGMMSRLVLAGFTPDEAFCLAQTAYIKEQKRAQGVPRSVMERQQVSFEINQTLKRLGQLPMGAEAHRQRIILWETVFGRGSWHEPIDTEEIYGPGAGPSAESIVQTLRLHKDADDAAFLKLSYAGSQENEFDSNLDKIRRGFQALAGGYSLLCTFETRESTHPQEGLVACTQDRIGVFTMQSLATSGDPLPGDRIMDFSLIRSVGYTIVPSELEAAELAPFAGFDLPRMAMRIIFDNDDVWDMGFSVEGMGGYGSAPYLNFVKGFHDNYQEWHTARFRNRFPPELTKEPAVTAAEPMTKARTEHTATLLTVGTVLVAGGERDGALRSAELFDPATGLWQKTAKMATARSSHTATLLPNGTVLFAGGSIYWWEPMASSELFDPAARLWQNTAKMATARSSHTATLLPNGKVLVAGGLAEYGAPLASSELYDPAAGTWTATGSMAVARHGHCATLLLDGTVLVCGGYANPQRLDPAELYNPQTGTWSTVARMKVARSSHCATLLSTGSVLVTGGFDRGVAIATTELYKPATETWSATADLKVARYDHSSTLMPDGTVLVVGGMTGSDERIDSVELFDPLLETWSLQTGLGDVRSDHTATLLANGTVLIAGGTVGNGDDSEPTASAVAYLKPCKGVSP